MPPKKRTSSGSVKSPVVGLKTIKDGETASVAGKVMSKTGVMTNAQTGNSWAWVEIQDSGDGGKIRVKGFGDWARKLSGLSFLETVEFHQFRVAKGYNGGLEASSGKTSNVDSVKTNLNPDNTWDQKEYGPLTDIDPGEEKPSQLNFLVKVLAKTDSVNEWISVDVVDEEKTKKTIKVHETHAKSVTKDGFLVIHRAKVLDESLVVDAWSMLVSAPEGYTFDEDD